ncbi:nucleolar RNA helicase 2-like isoform 2-T2 [Podargus strigoides]
MPRGGTCAAAGSVCRFTRASPKEKKETKSKHHDRSLRNRSQMDASEQSEGEVDSPKLKKSSSKEKQNGHARQESPENVGLSSLNVKSTHKNQLRNSSEASSGDSEQEQKEKKEKKRKYRERSLRKTRTDESEESEDEDDSPKLKKSRSEERQNGHVRQESSGNAKLCSLSVKSTRRKGHGNSSETSSGDSEQEQKEKKEKKRKYRERSLRKTRTDESEESEDEDDSPKLKKSRSEERQNGHVRQESSENAKLCSLSVKSTRRKGHGNSSETSSGDSEQEQEMTEEQKEGAFSNFSISKRTIQLLQARGVTYLFPVQVKTFNPVYSGKDVIAQARTGTGKTFSFAIPLIEKLQGDSEERRRGRSPKVLVLCPTRELANQVAKDFKDITRQLTVACFYGGTAYNGQIDLMRSGIDILVGTPGRIKDHLQSGKLDLTKVKHVVLDEVDQMLDMGFAEQVEDILRVAYKKDSEDNPQTLLFSATCPHWVYDVAKKYMKSKYEQIDLIGKRTQKAATTVEHLAVECHWSQRAAVIGDVIQVYSGSYGRTIVFCETKKEANELALNASIKQDCQSLHGDIPQKQREITLKGFRNGTFKVLVATNVAARGLDIPEVDLVVQCSPPKDVESYIHRSGRTGRAGRTGICICFYQRKEEYQLRHVEQKAGITFKRVGVPTARDIIKASSKDAIRCLDSVPQTAIEYFKESAQFLIQEKGPVNALAAALAHISGATAIEQRSLLNSDAGFVTMILHCSEEIHTMSYAWRRLRDLLGDDVDRKVNRMSFLKGKMGVCFDVPAADQKEIEARWEDSKQWRLCVATELPELEESQRGGGSGSNGRSSCGSRNRRQGGFGRNRFRSRGQKRGFDRPFNH